MGDWPNALGTPVRGVISTAGKLCGLGTPFAVAASWNTTAVWPAANRAIYCPIIIPDFASVIAFGWENGATVAGNIDVALYDINSAKVISTGSTAMSGVSVYQAVTVASTPVRPGNYWLAMITDSATATFRVQNTVAVPILVVMGQQQQATAIPLPAAATMVNAASAFTPLITVALGQTL